MERRTLSCFIHSFLNVKGRKEKRPKKMVLQVTIKFIELIHFQITNKQVHVHDGQLFR